MNFLSTKRVPVATIWSVSLETMTARRGKGRGLVQCWKEAHPARFFLPSPVGLTCRIISSPLPSNEHIRDDLIVVLL